MELHRQYGDPTALYPIAVMFDRLGRSTEAVTAYERYIGAGVETDPDRLAKIQEQLLLARARTKPPPPISKVADEKTPPARLPGIASIVPAQPYSLPAQAVPLRKKVWFWAVLGGGVAAVGLAVGLGFGLSGRTPTLPDGVNTYAPNF